MLSKVTGSVSSQCVGEKPSGKLFLLMTACFWQGQVLLYCHNWSSPTSLRFSILNSPQSNVQSPKSDRLALRSTDTP